jgi:glutaredoxin
MRHRGLVVMLVSGSCPFSGEAARLYSESGIRDVPLVFIDVPRNYHELLSRLASSSFSSSSSGASGTSGTSRRIVVLAREIDSPKPLPDIPSMDIVPQIVFLLHDEPWIAWDYGVDGVRSMIRLLEIRRRGLAIRSHTGTAALASSSPVMTRGCDKSTALATPKTPGEVADILKKWPTVLFWYAEGCPYSDRAMKILCDLGQPLVHVDMRSASEEVKAAVAEICRARATAGMAHRLGWTAPIFFYQGSAIGGSEDVVRWSENRSFVVSHGR